jgi:hypothetical protein
VDPDLKPTNPQTDDSPDSNDNGSLEAYDPENESLHEMQFDARVQMPMKPNPQIPTLDHSLQTALIEPMNVQSNATRVVQKLDAVMEQLKEWLDSTAPPFEDPEEAPERDPQQESPLDNETRQRICALSPIEQDACEDELVFCEDSISNVECRESNASTLTDDPLVQSCLQEQEEETLTQQSPCQDASLDEDVDEQQFESEHDEPNESTAYEDEESDEEWYECEEEGGEAFLESASQSRVLNDVSQTATANENFENVPEKSREMRPHRARFHEMKSGDRPLISILLEVQRRQQNAKQQEVSKAIIHRMQTEEDYSPKNERVLTNGVPECPATKPSAMCCCDKVIRGERNLKERQPECEGESDEEEEEAREGRVIEVETWPGRNDRTNDDRKRSGMEKRPNDDGGSSESPLDESGLQELLSFIDCGNVMTNQTDTDHADAISPRISSLSFALSSTTRFVTLPWTSWTNVSPSSWGNLMYVSNPEPSKEAADSDIVPAMPGQWPQTSWNDEDRDVVPCDATSVQVAQRMLRSGEIESREGDIGCEHKETPGNSHSRLRQELVRLVPTAETIVNWGLTLFSTFKRLSSAIKADANDALAPPFPIPPVSSSYTTSSSPVIPVTPTSLSSILAMPTLMAAPSGFLTNINSTQILYTGDSINRQLREARYDESRLHPGIPPTMGRLLGDAIERAPRTPITILGSLDESSMMMKQEMLSNLTILDREQYELFRVMNRGMHAFSSSQQMSSVLAHSLPDLFKDSYTLRMVMDGYLHPNYCQIQGEEFTTTTPPFRVQTCVITTAMLPPHVALGTPDQFCQARGQLECRVMEPPIDSQGNIYSGWSIKAVCPEDPENYFFFMRYNRPMTPMTRSRAVVDVSSPLQRERSSSPIIFFFFFVSNLVSVTVKYDREYTTYLVFRTFVRFV